MSLKLSENNLLIGVDVNSWRLPSGADTGGNPSLSIQQGKDYSDRQGMGQNVTNSYVNGCCDCAHRIAGMRTQLKVA